MSYNLTLDLHLLRNTKQQMQPLYSGIQRDQESVPLRMCPLARVWDFPRPRSGEKVFSHQ